MILTENYIKSSNNTDRQVESPSPQVQDDVLNPLINDQSGTEQIANQEETSPADQLENKIPLSPEMDDEPMLDNIVPEQIAENDPQPAQLNEIQSPSENNSVVNVTFNQLERIGSIMRNTVAKAAHPKLKFTPEWDDKTLTIALETDGYVAVASVNPFKNKH